MTRRVRKDAHGKRINIHLTYKCNLDCSYCCIKWHSGTLPTTPIISGYEWMDIIDSFYPDVQEIMLAGGEPMLHPDFVAICNHLLSKGHLLNIDTNLMSRKGLLIQRSGNLVFYVSKHKEMTDHQRGIWEKNFKDYKKLYQIRCDYPNIDDKLLTKEEGYEETFNRFRVMYDPRGRVYANFYELMKNQNYGVRNESLLPGL